MTPSPSKRSYLAPLLALSGARIKEFLREPGALFWTFGFPLLITVALGIAFRSEGPQQSAVAVVAAAGPQGQEAREVASLLGSEPGLSVTVLAPDDAWTRLRTGDIVLAIEAARGADGQRVVSYRF